MAQSLMAGMRLKYFIKEKDPDHVISWGDFLKFFSIAVRRYPKKGFQKEIFLTPLTNQSESFANLAKAYKHPFHSNLQ